MVIPPVINGFVELIYPYYSWMLYDCSNANDLTAKNVVKIDRYLSKTIYNKKIPCAHFSVHCTSLVKENSPCIWLVINKSRTCNASVRRSILVRHWCRLEVFTYFDHYLKRVTNNTPVPNWNYLKIQTLLSCREKDNEIITGNVATISQQNEIN